MNYSRAPFPRSLYAKFNTLAKKLGYTVRGQKWTLLEKLLAFADLGQHTRDMFRNRFPRR